MIITAMKMVKIFTLAPIVLLSVNRVCGEQWSEVDRASELEDLDEASLRALAERGNPDAQHRMAKKYFDWKRPEEFLKWLRLSAAQGYAKAEWDLCLCNTMGVGMEKNFAEAVRLARSAAEKNYHLAQAAMGEIYSKGLDGVIEKDESESVIWCMKAARNGNARSQRAIAWAYARGQIGSKKSSAEARRWMELAAKNGDDTASRRVRIWNQTRQAVYLFSLQYGKGNAPASEEELQDWVFLDEENATRFALWYMEGIVNIANKDIKVSGAGEKDALVWLMSTMAESCSTCETAIKFCLGACYENGWLGLKRNKSQADELYRIAKNQVNDSTFRMQSVKMALYYQDGLNGLDKNPKKSVAWMCLGGGESSSEREEFAKVYQAALVENNPKAQYELAQKFKNLKYIEKSDRDSQVMKWTLAAANAGIDEARHDLMIYYMGVYTEENLAEAEKWAVKWSQGNAEREYNLGAKYFMGTFGQSDWDKAEKWYLKAADKGYASAYESLWMLYAIKKDDYNEAKWLEKVADGWSLSSETRANAKYRLGCKYASGKGVSNDMDKALRLWKESARMGNKEAKDLLNRYNIDY